MVTSLKDLLHEEAVKNRDNKAQVEEWQAAIEQLFRDIQKWLKDADPDGAIEIERREQVINEPGLGTYRVPRLNLRVLGKWIGIIPRVRQTVGSATPTPKSAPRRADGRVDITDDLRRYVLYRFRQGDADAWVIDGLAYSGYEEKPALVHHVPRPDPQPFNKEAFEKALLSYLQ